MARILDVPGGAGALAAPEHLRPHERIVLETAPRRPAPGVDPKRARAFEGGAAFVLGLIPQGEGTKGAAGYDTVYGYDRFRPPGGPPVTRMTLNEVGNLQHEMLGREALAGRPERSTAFGKYQITSDTRSDIQKEMGLPGSTLAAPGVQDRMGRELLQMEGFDDYLRGRLSPQRFQENLAGRFSSFAAGPDDYSRYGAKVEAKVKTADIQEALAKAKAEHERYLQEDPYIRQRIEEGYMPDTTRWR